MKMFKPWLSLLAILLVVAMLLPGCKPSSDVSPDVRVVFSFPNGAPSLGHEAEMQCKVKSVHDINNFTVWVNLPESLQLISGELSWTGVVTKGQENLTVKALVRSIKTGRWEIGVHASFPSEQLPSLIPNVGGPIYLLITEDDAKWGITKPWQGGTEPASIDVNTTSVTRSPTSPLDIQLSVLAPPKVNEPFEVTCVVSSLYDVTDNTADGIQRD